MKKKWVVVLVVVAVIAVAVVLFFAVTGQKNFLWAEASFTDSSLSFYTCDGEMTWHGNLYDPEKEAAFVKMLSGIRVKKAMDWSPDKATYPMYAISIGTWKDRTIEALWTNGYLLLDDGNVYRTDYDFSSVREAWDWDMDSHVSSDRRELRYLPNMRIVVQTDTGWNPELMVPSRADVSGTEGITMEFVGIADKKIQVNLTNHRDAEWCFGESYDIEAFVDGVWYDIPLSPGEYNPIPAIGLMLKPGNTWGKTYALAPYGDLPAGTYRLIVEGMSVEFTLPAE